MTRAQWSAIDDYCEEFGYKKSEVLKELKANGAVDADATIKDLGDYTRGKTYDDMMNFLMMNL